MSAGFEKYRKGRGQCRLCDSPLEGRVIIALHGKAEGARNPYPQIATRSASFCEKHAVEVYERALASLGRP